MKTVEVPRCLECPFRRHVGPCGEQWEECALDDRLYLGGWPDWPDFPDGCPLVETPGVRVRKSSSVTSQ